MTFVEVAMTDDLVRIKIRDALAVSGNNRHDAQKLLITWAVRDQQLLLGLTKPHLKAIVAGFIDHALREQSAAGEGDHGPDHFSQTAIEDIVTSAKLNLPHDKRRKSNLPPPKATERQASTMRKLAAAFTKKKK
jgi:hypothetical protein